MEQIDANEITQPKKKQYCQYPHIQKKVRQKTQKEYSILFYLTRNSKNAKFCIDKKPNELQKNTFQTDGMFVYFLNPILMGMEGSWVVPLVSLTQCYTYIWCECGIIGKSTLNLNWW